MESKAQLKDIALLFLRLGFTAFGGPAAHIAIVRQEVVQKRKWISESHFLDLLGATNLIPGPNSTEVVMHVGKEKAGWPGLVVAGMCFIMPAVLITLLLAYLYHYYGKLPQVAPLLFGLKPAVVAIVLAAVFPLAKASVKGIFLAIIGVAALLLAVAGINEIAILFGAGFLGILLYVSRSGMVFTFLPFLILQPVRTSAFSDYAFFFTFLKIGAILYGSGYVLFAFLDAELVATGMLSRHTLADAIAVGQITPGPVFSSVTFVGYQLAGFKGAALATVAIFLPAFGFVAALNPIVRVMRNSALFGAFLDAVNVASVAVIAAVCIDIGKEAITDWRAALIVVICLGLSFGIRKLNSAFVLLVGALLGLAFSL